MEASSRHVETERRLILVNGQVDNIVEAVAGGRSSSALLDRLEVLESEKEKLERELIEAEPDPIRLHPNVAQLYVDKVANLRDALNIDGAREEAAAILRTLIDEIRLHPTDGELHIELIGDLATLLDFAGEYSPEITGPGYLGRPGRTKWLVAGARNHRELTLPPVDV